MPSHTAHTRVPRTPMQDIFNFSQLHSLCPSARTHPSAFLFLDFLSQHLRLRLSHLFLFVYFFPISLSFPSRITHFLPLFFSLFTHTHCLGVDFWVFFGYFPLNLLHAYSQPRSLSLSLRRALLRQPPDIFFL
jgi:hypothetical protein